ncbi:ABC transporter permease [Carboxylicivirga linearis]|uniref:ABC transporter permease n=1 Tax=Carboxylicivirga linearis TaxID=1628157 RepID=A0ABS5JTI6_9BACT|nr:ABC transporter permease [Carboxylicivirga linearis]MBS2098138.1 ABC transporter permease [Carboxylicivirga linearis]
MFDRDRWQEIFNAIKKNKLRSVLTAFGVFWAIFMLIVMTGSGNGLKNGITEGVKDFATNSAFMWSENTTVAFEGFKRGRHWMITNDDIVAIKDQVPEVEVISPRLNGWNLRSGENVVRGKRSAAFNVMGDYPTYKKIDPCTMPYGRYINDEDIRLKRKVCIIGEKVYEIMFDEGEDPVGEYIRVNGVYFMVVGVFKSNNPQINIGSNKKETVYLPFTSMQQTFNYGDQVHYFGITAKEGVKVSKVIDKITPILQKNHKISPEDPDAVGKVDIENQIQTMFYIFLGIDILIWVVGIGTLIAGAVGISNIMLVIVKERTKEIGIQRAIGARPAVIIGQLLTESVFLTTIAGFIGLAFGTFVLYLVDAGIDASRAGATGEEETFFLNPEIGLPLALSALAMLIFVGLIAGLIPAMKAIKIKPIEALRHE